MKVNVILNELIIIYIFYFKIKEICDKNTSRSMIQIPYTISCQEKNRHRRPLNEFVRYQK